MKLCLDHDGYHYVPNGAPCRPGGGAYSPGLPDASTLGPFFTGWNGTTQFPISSRPFSHYIFLIAAGFFVIAAFR